MSDGVLSVVCEAELTHDERMAKCYDALKCAEPVKCPVGHTITPGPPGWHVYTREFKAPAGTGILSEKHALEHVFTLSQGSCMVAMDGVNVLLTAPHTGVTKPGTQRLILVIEDITWVTTHVIPDTVTDDDSFREYALIPTFQPCLLQ